MAASARLRCLPDDVEVLEKGSSTNMTASDLPGPGRMLGKFYRKLGGHLETIINNIASRRNHGPAAIALRVSKRLGCSCWSCEAGYSSLRDTVPADKRHVKDIKKLILYTK